MHTTVMGDEFSYIRYMEELLFCSSYSLNNYIEYNSYARVKKGENILVFKSLRIHLNSASINILFATTTLQKVWIYLRKQATVIIKY